MVSGMAKFNKAAKTTTPVATEEVKVTPVAVEEKTAKEVKEVKSVKKAPVKKAAPKAAEKKEEESVNIFLQYSGKQFSTEEIIAKAKEAAAQEAGLKRLSSIKTIDIYCKPEEHAAYYVANGNKIVGRIDL